MQRAAGQTLVAVAPRPPSRKAARKPRRLSCLFPRTLGREWKQALRGSLDIGLLSSSFTLHWSISSLPPSSAAFDASQPR